MTFAREFAGASRGVGRLPAWKNQPLAWCCNLLFPPVGPDVAAAGAAEWNLGAVSRGREYVTLDNISAEFYGFPESRPPVDLTGPFSRQAPAGPSGRASPSNWVPPGWRRDPASGPVDRSRESHRRAVRRYTSQDPPAGLVGRFRRRSCWIPGEDADRGDGGIAGRAQINGVKALAGFSRVALHDGQGADFRAWTLRQDHRAEPAAGIDRRDDASDHGGAGSGAMAGMDRVGRCRKVWLLRRIFGPGICWALRARKLPGMRRGLQGGDDAGDRTLFIPPLEQRVRRWRTTSRIPSFVEHPLQLLEARMADRRAGVFRDFLHCPARGRPSDETTRVPRERRSAREEPGGNAVDMPKAGRWAGKCSFMRLLGHVADWWIAA